MPPVSSWWKKALLTVAAGFLLAATLSMPGAAQSQCGPTMAANTVCGRLGSGQAGPPQAIPFATFLAAWPGPQSANVVWAGPATGSAALPTWRALVGADLPLPSASTLGGIESLTCATHNWLSSISTAGVPACSQPAFTDISGTLALASQVSGTLPGANMAAVNPGTSGNGGIAYADGHVNILRNSSLAAWSHGCVAGTCTHTTTAATTNYSAEGIFVLPTGASVTSQAVTTCPAGNPGFYCDKITGLTSNTDIKIRWVVESYSAAKIAGLQATFQFTFINNSGATITPALSTKFPTTQDGSVTSGASWGGSTADLGATNLTACTNGSTCVEAYTFPVSASATAGYEFVVDFGAMASNSDTLTIGAGFDARATVGISTGINASPPAPEVRSPAEDIAWCERFYAASYNNTVAPGASTHIGIAFVSGSTTGGMTAIGEIVFPGQLRATPTIATWDGAGNASKITSIPVSGASSTFTDNQTNVAIGAIGTGAAGFAFVASASSTAGLWAIHYTADATLWGG